MQPLEHSNVGELAEFLGARREEIIERWLAMAGELPHARKLDRTTLTDHIPNLVAEVIRSLAATHDGAVREEVPRDSPPVHGVQRLYDGLDAGEVVAEYNLLRHAFIAVSEQNGRYVVGEAARIINRRIDKAVALAVDAYAAENARLQKEQHREYLAFIAHDLRTPLQAVGLLVEELDCVLPPDARGEIDVILHGLRENLRRVSEQVAHVLDTHAGPTEPGTSFRPEIRTFDLWPLVQRLIVDFRPVSSKSRITVLNQIPRNLAARADASLLSQVFQNLLGNAFKYAVGGTVVVTAHDQGRTLTCVVRDNGPGIPPGLLPSIFDKLAHDPAKDGKGLGLAIVKQIVEAHGGTVKAESVPGQGATFTFTIPASQ